MIYVKCCSHKCQDGARSYWATDTYVSWLCWLVDVSLKVWNPISRMPGVHRFLQCLCFLGRHFLGRTILIGSTHHLSSNKNIIFFKFCFLSGILVCISHTWHINMPSKVKGLLNSCLVIPCSFGSDYSPPHNPNRVVWYQYAWATYPLVYDSWYPKSVVDIFRDKTSRAFIHASGKECSLQIYPVTRSHHKEVIYPWIDPENVGSSTYPFFDKTVTIEVMGKLWQVWGCFFQIIPLIWSFSSLIRQCKKSPHYNHWEHEGRRGCDCIVQRRTHLSNNATNSPP